MTRVVVLGFVTIITPIQHADVGARDAAHTPVSPWISLWFACCLRRDGPTLRGERQLCVSVCQLDVRGSGVIKRHKTY